MTDPPHHRIIAVVVLLLSAAIASAQSPACAAYYPQYCSEDKCDAPECEIYADGSGSLLLAPGSMVNVPAVLSDSDDFTYTIHDGADLQPMSEDMPNEADSYAYSTTDEGWATLIPPVYSGVEIHGDVVCNKDGDGLFQCGVAPTFGECPDGYLKTEFTNGWPTTCWPQSADDGIIVTISDSGPTEAWTIGRSGGKPWAFNRITTSTANPARTGTMQTAHYLPPAPSSARYPHTWFVLEASCIAGAIFEDARGYGASEYYRGGVERHRSVGRFAAINVPIGLALGLGGWKLEASHHRSLRILGHVAMWGAVGAYSADYFHRSEK